MVLGAIGFGASVLHESSDPTATETKPTTAPSPSQTPGIQASETPVSSANPPASSLTPNTDPAAPPVNPIANASPMMIHPLTMARLAGTWRGEPGFRAEFQQNGNAFDYIAYEQDKRTGTGAGTLSGRTLRYHFRNETNGDDGPCEATLSADGKRIDASCRSSGGGAPWTFSLTR
jgi:hypothetical protein